MKVKMLINVIPYEDDTRYKRVTYEQVKKACGKRSCRTCDGERLAHGPYWYKCEWDADGHKKRTVYVGKELPPEAEEALLAKRFLSAPSFRALVHQAQDLHEDLSRRKKENAFLHQKIARLEAELAEARARAPRVELSGTVKLERAAKVYASLQPSIIQTTTRLRLR
jgi:signal-transduction protein with cAMP-binding, CBS, and nucleotidyltransferase domain